jgi:hypothetical protein
VKAGRLTIKTKLPSGLSCACVRLGFAQPRIAHYLLSALAASSGEFVSFAPWYRPASRSAQEPTKKTTLISQREPSSTVLMRAEQHKKSHAELPPDHAPASSALLNARITAVIRAPWPRAALGRARNPAGGAIARVFPV